MLRPLFHFVASQLERRSRWAAGLFFAAVLVGCSPAPNPDAGTDGGPLETIELGTTDGQGAYVALQGDAFAEPGAQGGYHINTFFRLPAGGQGRVTFDYRVVRSSDDKLVSLGTRSFDLGLFKVASWTNPAPVTVFMCPTPVGVDIIGQELTLTVKSRDEAGRSLGEGRATAVFRCGPNAGTYCVSICKG
jgi:hypothetical protein